MEHTFAAHITHMLGIARDLMHEHPELYKAVGTTNARGETTIEMDIKIEEALISYLKNTDLPIEIFSEEEGVIKCHEAPEYLVVIDPLDGSVNYKFGKGQLPFGVLISFSKGLNPNIGDVVAAGTMEFTQDRAWVFDGTSTKTLIGEPTRIDNWPVHPTTPFYLDLYFKRGYEAYRPLAQQIFVRNTGSTAGNLALLLSGVSGGMGGACIKSEEAAAVYGLVTGAGGNVVDHAGKDIGSKPFSREGSYELLGAHPNLAQKVVGLLEQNNG